MADLLRRRAAGDKLTPAEHGKIGAWKSKQQRKPPAGAFPSPAESGMGGPGQLAPMDQAAPEAQPGIVPFAQSDADLVSRTVKALLGKANATGQRHLLAAARAAGADAAALARFSTAEVVSADDATVLSDTAPLVAASMGVNPRQVPVAAFFGTLAACGLNFLQAIAELKEIQAAQAKRAAESTPTKS